MSRRRRRHRSFRRTQKDFHSRKRAGYGMNIYRNKRDAKVAGVAAGLADYWDVAHWVVRLIWVGAFLFTGTLAFWLYVAGWIAMAPRPTRRNFAGSDSSELEFEDVDVDMEYDERHQDYRPRKVFRYSEDSSVRLKRARERMDAALRRVEDMESYVTSRQYDLNKEFSKL